MLRGSGGLDAMVEPLARYIQEQKPTAIISSSYALTQVIGDLVQAGRFSVPRDFSLVTFDQCQHNNARVAPEAVTTVELPLYEMGRQLTRYARQCVEGVAPPPLTELTCTLREGRTVLPPPGPAG